jgi:hypothetical protein
MKKDKDGAESHQAKQNAHGHKNTLQNVATGAWPTMRQFAFYASKQHKTLVKVKP